MNVVFAVMLSFSRIVWGPGAASGCGGGLLASGWALFSLSPHAMAATATKLVNIEIRIMVHSCGRSFEAVFDTADHGGSDLIGKDLDSVLHANDALAEEVGAGELESQMAGQRLGDGEIEPVKR